MRVVSETPERELAENRARQQLIWPLRNLTANILRVTRGAGNPHDLGRQALHLVEAFEAYREAVGCYPSEYDIKSALDLEFQHRTDETDWATLTIARGSLQWVASRLIGQSAQVAAGERELLRGVEQLERAWATVRAKPRPLSEWDDTDT